RLRSLLTACELPARGTVPAERTAAATACLSARYAERIAALRQPAAGAPAAPVSPPPDAVGPPAARLSASLFPVAPYQEARLTVEQFGRYALMTKSPRGTALQLVDRMAGPGAIVGNAGLSDGRSDVFLDRGTYKVVLFGADAPLRAGEEAGLTVKPF